MPRLTLLAVVLSVSRLAAPLACACALLCPTIVAADSSEALTERYIASTFRAMADAAIDASSDDDAAAALGTVIRNAMAVDETARFVLGRDWPTQNPQAGARFRQQFLHFASNALAGALRAHRGVTLQVKGSRLSDGRILVDSALVLRPGLTLPLTWIVRPEGPKGRRRIEDFVLAGIDARMMLRNAAAVTLEQRPGDLDAVAAMFDRLARKAGAPAATAESGTSP
ncbi:MAG TPA: ABC transporter substrate-binding protein [Dongiaceae bacterium]|jgi:ABC-type transporter MlaC component|nr:ABC transporter substrate-binding protein [Dongiaceae bacterium]